MSIRLSRYPLDALSQDLQAAAAHCGQEQDATLQRLGAGLLDLADRLARHLSTRQEREAVLRRQLLGLDERLRQLRLLLNADAALLHSEPARAQAAAYLLLRVPWPLHGHGLAQGDGTATVVPAGGLSAEGTRVRLATVDDVLAALRDERAALRCAALGLGPLLQRIAAQRDEAGRLAQEVDRGGPEDPEGAAAHALRHEAALGIARLRAWARVLCAPLHPQPRPRELAERVLGPLAHLQIDLPIAAEAHGAAPCPFCAPRHTPSVAV